MLTIGDPAPDFQALSDQNQLVALQDLRGKKIILYFYPKDNTPGCTREACDFRDQATTFKKYNAEIIGISKDGLKNHEKFKQKYDLPFTLLSDENGDICAAYGVLNKKSLWGRTFLGIQRSTFLIDEKGIIRAIWRNVKVAGHTEQVIHEISQC